jgi:murein DD-endopeptidase MepM/ murein hydrolase activator NlpD
MGESMDCKRKILRTLLLDGCFLAALGFLAFYQAGQESESTQGEAVEEAVGENKIWTGLVQETAREQEVTGQAAEKTFIQWVDFQVAAEALEAAMEADVDTYGSETPISWTDLLAYEATRTGGSITASDADSIRDTAEKIKSGQLTVKALQEDNPYFSYYKEAYEAVLGGMLGEYEREVSVASQETVSGSSAEAEGTWETVYGLKAFHPIASGFAFSDYDDFGVSRTFGYKRRHLGHDMMGLVGTPIIAVESGYVEAIGWNRYGGWRIGIRSFDKKRYYYYAHLRQNYPFAEGLSQGDVVTAGDVIGYMGHTGYSEEENVNNIEQTHLHFGLQLIFDESQKDGESEIWIDCYQLVRFLYRNRQTAAKVGDTREWKRTSFIRDPATETNP